MNDRDLQLKRRIMRRVWMVWFIRQAIHPTVLKALVAVLFFWRSTAYVSYGQVFENAPSLANIPGNLSFAWNAATHTEMTTLLLVVSVLALGVWTMSDIAKEKHHAHAL